MPKDFFFIETGLVIARVLRVRELYSAVVRSIRERCYALQRVHVVPLHWLCCQMYTVISIKKINDIVFMYFW